MGDLTYHQRRALCDFEDATLNGEPARITGAALPFAQVCRADGTGRPTRFGWQVVERVVDAGGQFRA